MAFNLWETAKKSLQNPLLALSNADKRLMEASKGYTGNLATDLYKGASAFWTPQTASASEPVAAPTTTTSAVYGPSSEYMNQPTEPAGDTGTSTESFMRYLNGVQYTDPVAFTNAVTQSSIDEFNRQNKLLTDAYNAGLLDFGTYKEQIEQARQTVKDQYGQAMGSISGRFSALSPDAYQSSQGTAENRAKDITNQNYANINTQEANLGLQRSQYDQDYQNKLAANQVASQNQIDQTINSALGELAGTQYANSLNRVNAPQLNTMTPMDNTVLGNFDAIAQLSQAGNLPAVRQRISELNVEPNIKDWLYTRFANTVGA